MCYLHYFMLHMLYLLVTHYEIIVLLDKLLIHILDYNVMTLKGNFQNCRQLTFMTEISKVISCLV